jgi:uncharacterized protein YcgI (DUF1989 family)
MTPFDPAVPDGTNASLDLAISPDGTPVPGQVHVLPARCGMAVRVAAGQVLSVVNPSGTQVCDFWAFAAEDLGEHLSMAHLHTTLSSIMPRVGDPLVSNMRRTLMTLVHDSSPGVHDTVIASCDHARYREMGVAEYHDNCADNLRMALMAIGLRAPAIPAPFNLWMNVPVQPDGKTSFEVPVANAGDEMRFRAEVDVIAVMSACPQDLSPVNGIGVPPGPLAFSVMDG